MWKFLKELFGVYEAKVETAVVAEVKSVAAKVETSAAAAVSKVKDTVKTEAKAELDRVVPRYDAAAEVVAKAAEAAEAVIAKAPRKPRAPKAIKQPKLWLKHLRSQRLNAQQTTLAN